MTLTCLGSRGKDCKVGNRDEGGNQAILEIHWEG